MGLRGSALQRFADLSGSLAVPCTRHMSNLHPHSHVLALMTRRENPQEHAHRAAPAGE